MNQYTFTCSLPGCGTVMIVHAPTKEQGLNMLVEKAHEHLASVHPDIHKTHEEVTADISSHIKEVAE